MPAGETQFLHLTTTGRRSGRPREIELWFTRFQGRYYVISYLGLRAHWIRNILKDSAVRFRVGAQILSGRARLLDAEREGTLGGQIHQLSQKKI